MISVESYSKLKELIEKAKETFNSFDKEKVVRVISHLDADGIAAASIMVKLLNELNFIYSLSVVQQLRINIIEELSYEDYGQLIFCDLGSGQLKSIMKLLPNRKILILDHHVPEKVALTDNIVHVNPHLADIDGNGEISGSGVVYLFARSILPSIIRMAHVAVIGAIGDVQEKKGFAELNNAILNDAISYGTIQVKHGLSLFGMQTKPLFKVLEYSTDPYIPGVTGSESAAMEFLQYLGINPRFEDGWKKLIHLTEDEMKRLVAGIVMRRVDEKKPEDILGPIYIVVNEAPESPTKDAREFSTLLNACGRMNKPSLGIGACLGDKESKEKAGKCLMEYKSQLIDAINWYERNKNSDKVVKGNGYIIINAEDHILPTIVGTLASILSKSKDIANGTLILSLAQLIDNTTKISLRVAGYDTQPDVNLRKIVIEICKEAGGEAGGHKDAAGANIPTSKEKEFIEVAKRVLENKAMEEMIV